MRNILRRKSGNKTLIRELRNLKECQIIAV
nr:MAG TPA: hypothetical protein [Caudoviricetes sp.]